MANQSDQTTDARVTAIRDASGHTQSDAEHILRGLHRFGWDVVRIPRSSGDIEDGYIRFNPGEG